MARPQTPLLETLFDEVNRLAAAAGGEGVHTKALDWIRQVDEAVRLLWDAALLGVDAYPSLAAEKVSQAKRILDSRGDIEGEQESGNEGIGEETVAKAVRGQKDRQALLREALTVLKEIRSLLRTLP
jgi:hypothetical protein